jgi:hypothetical protein
MTDVKQVIKRQVDRSGNTLMLGLEPVSDDEFFAENATGFSAAWTVGHLACVADLFSSWFDGYLTFGREFHQVFNDTGVTAARPVSRAEENSKYSKENLLFSFRQGVTKALRTLEVFDAGQWDAPAPPHAPASLLTGGSVWEHLAVHVYWHCGELAGSMPRFYGTYTLNTVPHYFYVPPQD